MSVGIGFVNAPIVMNKAAGNRTAVILVLAVVLVTMRAPVFSQVSLTPDRRPFLTADQIAAVFETPTAAAAIVSESLAHHVRVFPNKTTTVIGTQIPEHWLPASPVKGFRRLTDDAARAHLQECGRLLFVNSFTLSPSDVVTIDIAEGSRCSISGLTLRFNRSADGWRLDLTGLGGGFASATSHCPCK